MPRWTLPHLERFGQYWIPERGTGCHVWIGTTGGSRSTYGYFSEGQRKQVAHRWVWEATVGPIPPGMELDHLCRNTLCVNVDHLEVVTPTENKRRARLRVCRNGIHDLSDESNCDFDGKGRRRGCKPCRKEHQRLHKANIRRMQRAEGDFRGV